MGAKRRNTTFWLPSILKADASYPAPGDIVTGSTYFDCSNLKISALREMMGVATNRLYELGNLPGSFAPYAVAGYVNAWARYKPGQTDYDVALPALCYEDPSFIYTAPGDSGACLGDYAGYNHAENTRPVYWGSPHDDENQYVVWSTTEIRGGLQRGKLCPILGHDPEDEYYWSHVKVQAWLRADGFGDYALVGTSDFIDLTEPTGETATLLFTMGAHGEIIGNDYTVCLRPVYMAVDGTTPLAVCEGGVELLTYRMWGTAQDIADAFSVTVNSVATSHPVQYTHFDYDFDLNNLTTHAMDCYVRLRAEDNDAWFTYDYIIGYDSHINASSFLNFANEDDLGQTLYAGTFKLLVQVSFDVGVTWITVGSVGDALEHWASE